MNQSPPPPQSRLLPVEVRFLVWRHLVSEALLLDFDIRSIPDDRYSEGDSTAWVAIPGPYLSQRTRNLVQCPPGQSGIPPRRPGPRCRGRHVSEHEDAVTSSRSTYLHDAKGKTWCVAAGKDHSDEAVGGAVGGDIPAPLKEQDHLAGPGEPL